MTASEDAGMQYAPTREEIDRDGLMVRTAEMLAMPSMCCPSRQCARTRRCGFLWSITGEPMCLLTLDEEERAVYDALLACAVEAHAHLIANAPMPLSSEPEARALQQVGIEIALPFIGTLPANRPLLRRWLRRHHAAAAADDAGAA